MEVNVGSIRVSHLLCWQRWVLKLIRLEEVGFCFFFFLPRQFNNWCASTLVFLSSLHFEKTNAGSFTVFCLTHELTAARARYLLQKVTRASHAENLML